MTVSRVVVVGAGLAGATAATRLRRLGHEGPITLLGDEPHLPYERPALSKTYLTGETTWARLLVHPADTYDDLDIDVRLGCRAVALEVDERVVVTEDGRSEPYDALLIATGSRALRLPVPGMDLPGVHRLRTADDADALAAAASTASTAVVVGMGFVGCEVAATLRRTGLAVTLVDRADGPLQAQLGSELSRLVAGWHREHGVRLIGGAAVTGFEGGAAVEAVRLDDGRLLPADLVVVGVGVRPATDWLARAPLHLVRGAVGVDERGCASVPGVYAIGDVAATWDPVTGRHRRIEHYRSALDQGERVAHALAGLPAPAATPSWFWSDQYDHVLHYAGDREDDDAVHCRDEPFAAFYVRGIRLTAVATVDNGRDFRRALRLLGTTVDAARLTDPATDLRRLAGAAEERVPQPT